MGVRRPMAMKLSRTFAAFAEDLPLHLVIVMLLATSFLATLVGMVGFISTADASTPFATIVATIFMVFALTLAMFVALRETLRPRRWFHWLPAAAIYGFLALWSIGFGYGFWWSLIAGEDATRRELQAALTDFDSQTARARSGVDAAGLLMASAAELSEDRARQETTTGGTCGAPSAPGDGPRFRARMRIRSEIASIEQAVRERWLTPLNADFAAMRTELEGALSDTSSARRAHFFATYSKVAGRAAALSETSSARGAAFADELRAVAASLEGSPVNATVCADPPLAQRLRSAAGALDRKITITPRPPQFSEGADGVAQAIDALWSAAARIVGGGALSARTSGAANIAGRDLVALAATIGVDFALFVFTLLLPRRRGHGSVERQRSPSKRYHRTVKQLAQSAFANVGGADSQQIAACFGVDQAGRYLAAPDSGVRVTEPDARLALAIGGFLSQLSAAGEIELVQPSGEDVEVMRRRLLLAGWPAALVSRLSVYAAASETITACRRAALDSADAADAALPARAVELLPRDMGPDDNAEPAAPALAAPTTRRVEHHAETRSNDDDEDTDNTDIINEIHEIEIRLETETDALARADLAKDLNGKLQKLAARGVLEIDCSGFANQDWHEIEYESNAAERGRILRVKRRGFIQIDDHSVLRAADVVVSDGGERSPQSP